MTPGTDPAGAPALSRAGDLVDRRERALAALDAALGQPPLELQEEVDTAERAIVRLRDALIDRLRQHGEAPEAAGWRAALQQVNAALSLVVAVEYPVAAGQRKRVEQARDALQRVAW